MITFIINSNTYRIDPSDLNTIDAMSATDKQQLVELLVAIKRHDEQAKIKAQALLKRANQVSTINQDKPTASVDQATPRTERLRSGDVDALMARLAMEESSKQKAGLTKSSIYKFVGGLAVVIILLIVIL